MSADDWRDILERAAECGSDCLRDTWVMVPADMRSELAVWHWKRRVAAVAADAAVGGTDDPVR
jgi:hypothetical protein